MQEDEEELEANRSTSRNKLAGLFVDWLDLLNGEEKRSGLLCPVGWEPLASILKMSTIENSIHD